MSRSLDRIAGNAGYKRPLAANRFRVIQDILDGMTITALAKKYQVSTNSVAVFKRQHKAEIAAARDNFEHIEAAARLVNRENRLFELDALAWQLRDKIDERISQNIVKLGDDKTSDLIREFRGLLSDIEETAGQKLPRTTDQATTTTVNVIITRNGEDLMAKWDKPFVKDEAKAIEAAPLVIEGEVADGEDEKRTA